MNSSLSLLVRMKTLNIFFFLLIIILLGSQIAINLFHANTSQDLKLYFEYSQKLFEGRVPFKDYLIEYPPAAFYLMAVPYFFAKTFPLYKFLFSVFVAINIITVCIHFFYKKQWLNNAIVFASLLCLPSEIIYQRIDSFLGVLVFWNIIMLLNKKYIAMGIFLGIAISIKFIPIILIPLLIIALRKKKIIYQTLLSWSMTIIILLIPFFLSDAPTQNLLNFWTYNQTRGIQLESSWSSLTMVLENSKYPVSLHDSHNSLDIQSPYKNMLTKIAMLSIICYLLFIYYFAYKKKIKNLAALYFLTLCGFIILNKVFSPQYLLWIVFIFPLAIQTFSFKDKCAIILSFLAVLFLTHLILPYYYLDLVALKQSAKILLISRNALLIATLLLFLNAFIKNFEKIQAYHANSRLK